MYAWEFQRALHIAGQHGWSRFVSMQNHYNLIYREEEREMLPLCRFHGIAACRGVRWHEDCSPANPSARPARHPSRGNRRILAPPLLPGARLSGSGTRGRGVGNGASRRPRLRSRWLLSRPGITAPVVGATRPEHVNDAVASLDIQLDEEEVRQLEEGYRPHPVLGHEGPPC